LPAAGVLDVGEQRDVGDDAEDETDASHRKATLPLVRLLYLADRSQLQHG
jgi:hypothetical protein